MKPLHPIPAPYRADYLQHKLRASVAHMKTIFWLFTLLYALFGLVDVFLFQLDEPSYLLIRYGAVVPLFVFTIRLMDYPLFERVWQPLVLADFMLAGAGITHMLINHPDNITYYGGMFMIMFSGYLLIRLDTPYALFGGLFHLALFTGGYWLQHGTLGRDPLLMVFFFAAANVIGFVGNYQLERSLFHEFLAETRGRQRTRALEMDLQKKAHDLEAEKTGTIFALAKMVESKDAETGEHIERIGALSRLLVRSLDPSYCLRHGFRQHSLAETIRVASVLHDIGKVAIPQSILLKPGKLNPEELRVMRTHPRIGARIIQTVLDRYPDNEFMRLGYDIALSHHERWDGSGYPNGLIAEAIPLTARIVALADVYDALVSRRPYKEPYTHGKAMEIIAHESGAQFDPYLCHMFQRQERAIRSIYGTNRSQTG